MRYGSLVASTVVLLGLAACKGNDAGVNDALAKDLASAKNSDALALAPHTGVQTIVSAQELSPQGRGRRMAQASMLRKSARTVARRTPHRDLVAVPVPTAIKTAVVAEVPSPTVAVKPTPADASVSTATVSQRPEQIPVQYPPTDPDPPRVDRGGIGGIIGAIGGVILRGGVGDGDHCDPRSHGNRGGGILINRRGPIIRGTF